MNENKQHDLSLDNPNQEIKKGGSVECLGKTFVSDAERREYYLALLAEKLKDPEFRKIEGFPIGEDEAILELSDPPYYTACPNPFIEDFIAHYGRVYNPVENYRCEPYAADVTEGRNNPIYNAHSYHTKVPHKAIMRYILNYTKPGDIVLDSFCGSGMTGVAAQMCGSKKEVESLGYYVADSGKVYSAVGGAVISKIGSRFAVLNDLSPMATFLANNFNSEFDNEKLQADLDKIILDADNKLGWMYSTNHDSCDIDKSVKLLKNKSFNQAAEVASGRVNYILWSDIFVCPECATENVFWDVAVDIEKSEVKDKFNCFECGSLISKSKAEKSKTSVYDQDIGESIEQAKVVPVAIGYTYRGKKYEKKPDQYDRYLIECISLLEIEGKYPSYRMPEGREGRRNDSSGLTHVHHFYTRRNLAWLAYVNDNLCNDRLCTRQFRNPRLKSHSHSLIQ